MPEALSHSRASPSMILMSYSIYILDSGVTEGSCWYHQVWYCAQYRVVIFVGIWLYRGEEE
jgi:hypothetical protein